jgi:hypothetical protein
MNAEILTQELRQCQDTLLFLKSISGIGVHDYDILSGDIQWDQRVRELWGVPSDMPVNYDVFMQGLHPDDRAKTQTAVDNSLEPGGNGHYEAEYRVINLTDKKTRWIAAVQKTRGNIR